jgi:hypothetical protein
MQPARAWTGPGSDSRSRRVSRVTDGLATNGNPLWIGAIVTSTPQMMRLLGAIALIITSLVAVCNANESTVEYAGIQEARTLAGQICDAAGAPITGVAVEEMSDDWSKVMQQTTTDSQGRWSLPELRGRRTHYIRFLKPAFHPVQIRVRLRRSATKPLDFELPVS